MNLLHSSPVTATKYPYAFSFVLMMLIAGCGSPSTGTLADLEKELAAEGVVAVGEAGPGLTNQLLVPEKSRIKLGFIKLTDCAALVIAKEKGFFAEEGLNVELESQANWKVLLDRVIGGELDGAHMLAGQPIGATIGFGTQANVITAFSMNLNGNAITVSNRVWAEMQQNDSRLNSPTPPHPITADALKPVIQRYKSEGKPFNLGIVFPVSTHNYELRYWLASAGIDPGMYTVSDTTGTIGAEAILSVTPPPQMPATLESGTIDGYCVGEPWNQAAVSKGIGVPVCTNYEIWKNNPEKVFGVTQEWNDQHPVTHLLIIKALIRAGKWLDETKLDGSYANRMEAVDLLSRSSYVGAEKEVLANSLTGYFYFQKSDKREMPDFSVFFKYNATYPFYSDCVWFLTQMRRWGQITEPKSDAWYHETAKKIYRSDIYLKAAQMLVEEGKIASADIPWDSDGYKPATSDFLDAMEYDGHRPNDYLKQFVIGNKN
jgi:nitrate/nitrite transport system substrate-binding protein